MRKPLSRDQIEAKLAQAKCKTLIAYYERVLAGQCVGCGGQPAPGRRRCAECASVNLDRVKRCNKPWAYAQEGSLNA